jgi:NAD(P)-dependent dehydrogenase (short-subunit alcohol dehydrogenase family)
MSSIRPVAIVTGGRRGIGAAIAVALAKDGFDVAITDLDSAGAERTVAEITATGARGVFVQSDLAAVADHARVAAAVLQWGGPIACLVNNAGVPAPKRGDLLELTPEAFDRVLEVNLRGTLSRGKNWAFRSIRISTAIVRTASATINSPSLTLVVPRLRAPI